MRRSLRAELEDHEVGCLIKCLQVNPGCLVDRPYHKPDFREEFEVRSKRSVHVDDSPIGRVDQFL